jgi:protease I
MATEELKGKKVLIIATDGFEDTELLFPRIVLMARGAVVDVTGKGLDRTLKKAIKGKVGYVVDLDEKMKGIKAKDYDALVIPGGQSPDRLRTMEEAVRIAKEFAKEGKIIAAVCHGPQLLIEADVVRGKRMTSWRAVKTDLINAGAEWVDEEVVVDGNFITSRFPPDLYAWTEAIVLALKG